MPLPAIIATVASAAAPLIGSGILVNAFSKDSPAPEAGQQPGFFSNVWDSITGFVGGIFGKDEPMPVATIPPAPTTNWALIGGIMAGAAVLIILIVTITRRK